MSEHDDVGIVGGVVHPATCFGDPHYDALVAELPDSCFGDESYDALVAQLPISLFHKSTDDFEDESNVQGRTSLQCELGTIIGHSISSTKLLPSLLSGINAVVCVVIVFDAMGSLSGAVCCHQARDCYLLPYMGATPASLREWLVELKGFLHYVGVDGFRAKRLSVNVLQAEWRLQALACCDDALGDVLDVQYLASSFLGISTASALEEACIMERRHGGSCFVKAAQTGRLERHWVQGLLDCARVRSLKSLVSRALCVPDAPSTASSFMELRELIAALAQRGARTGILIDFNRLDIVKRSASSHRPRTPLLKTIKSNCDHVALACASHGDSRYRWCLTYNSVSGELSSDLQNFPEFSTNLCSRVAVALPALLSMVHTPTPPFAAFTLVANARQDVTVLSILDHGQRVIIRAEDGSESEALSSSIQVLQLVRGEHLSVRSALVSDYGSCFVAISIPMSPWIFLGEMVRASVISAFAARSSSDFDRKKLCFDRSEAAACATAAISNLLAASLPQLVAHKRCICMRLALSSQRHDVSTWASELELELEAARDLQFMTVAALSDILTGPPHTQHLPFHVVKPSLLGRRAPSQDTFFEAALQHAWMSSADLMQLLARESENGLRECLAAKLNIAEAAAVASDGHAAACERSSTHSAAGDCFSLVAVLSHTIIFSCRRIFIDSALIALSSSAARLRVSFDIDFPCRVAAGDNIGTHD